MTDLTGQKYGNYVLISLLGEGGFAEVYLGEHVHLKTQAAIKILRVRMAKHTADSFVQEARTIAHLDHSHIVHVLEFGVEDHIPFLVMSYAPYGTVRNEYPRGTQIPLPIVISYIQQAASALQYAHDQKLIHRDIKPENMLLNKQNEILLSDFGIALIDQSSRYRTNPDVAGTITYMAPEQLKGQPCAASDQYALAITAYEWLSGERPFKGSFMEIYTQHMAVAPPPLNEKYPFISPEIEQVLFRALEKDPQQRFPDIQSFANALQQAYQSYNDATRSQLLSTAKRNAVSKPSVVSPIHTGKAVEPITGSDIVKPSTSTTVQLEHLVPNNTPVLTAPLPVQSTSFIRQRPMQIAGLVIIALLIVIASLLLPFMQQHTTAISTKTKVAVEHKTITTPTPRVTQTPEATAKPKPTPTIQPTPTQQIVQSVPPAVPQSIPSATAIVTATPAPAPAPVGAPVATTPTTGDSLITCGGSTNGGSWKTYNQNGYVGAANAGGQSSCNGSFLYILTPTTASATLFSNQAIPAGKTNAQIWVYVPTKDAGANAIYTIYFDGNSSAQTSINQNKNSFWQYIYLAHVPSGAHTISLTVSSNDTSWYLADDAAALRFY